MNLTTSYLGLALRNPLVASAGPMTQTAAGIERLAGAGVGAVVLPSLFEEQIRAEADRDARPAEAGADSTGEARGMLAATADAVRPGYGRRGYLTAIEQGTHAYGPR